MNDDIHSCSYECMRYACILRQRNELAARETLTTPLMRIDGKAYKEAKPVQSMQSDCNQCAFARDRPRCGAASDGAAKAVFGGDCEVRDVIYEEVPNL